MAMFFGTIQGGRGKATRLGHANTGLKVTAQSFVGSIIVNLYRDAVDDVQCVNISIAPSSASHGGRTLYDGPIVGLFSDQVTLGGNR